MLDNQYFHSTEKGCKIVSMTISANNENKRINYIQGGYCKKHKVKICRCGWEWGHHYGTDSKKINKKVIHN